VSGEGWAAKIRAISWALAALLVAGSLWMAAHAPLEVQMGIVQKIIYIHVPSATAAITAFFVTFMASIVYLVSGRNWRWDAIAVSSCEVGMVFSAIVLVTGPLWARSAWNTWWTWEPRLTSFLIMWILYGGYFLIRSSVGSGSRRDVSAVLGVILFVSVIITYMSVTWWRGSLHPKSVTMVPEMRGVLSISIIAWLVFYAAAFQERFRLETLRHAAESGEDAR